MKAFLILILAAGLASAGMASDLDFDLVNKTSRDFEAIYISSSAEKSWHGNLLADGRKLDPRDTLKIRFSDKETSPTWDINIVDADGLSVAFDDVKLAGAQRIILTESEGKLVATVE
ncbi:hypothetical protein TSACC_22294 [Terrimicrobium sacchariphilum]|jgi:hypothetical protein|uniref:Uncharacterized protein n=1 Tax=Terrimicrobium sacchariphilum TaxID=690879 RepID=A0A146GAM1_TERSA|nr:hypothetical protein [Terrimicrobium sacchariphilum]GAT33874.1 hypothetical protein TSACC_22294 [Terrimicrobium sacchariphilum]